VYNLLSELLGVASTSGCLGSRMSVNPAQSWWYFSKVGTIRTPLFYDKDSKDTSRYLRRLFPEVFLYISLILQLFHILLLIEPAGLMENNNLMRLLLPVLMNLLVLGVFDVVVLLASRIEVYGYMLIGICLVSVCDYYSPTNSTTSSSSNKTQSTINDHISIVHLVQTAVWFFAGVAKCGPWFTYFKFNFWNVGVSLIIICFVLLVSVLC